MLQIEELTLAYSNEKATKKLLKYEEVVDEFNRYIYSNEPPAISTEISKTIEEIELERIAYFVKEYILMRMDKIRHHFFLDLSLMSESEKTFYIEYLECCKRTGIYVDQPSKEIEIVGFVANKTLDGVKIDGELVEITKGDFFVASFDDVETCLNEGAIHLV